MSRKFDHNDSRFNTYELNRSRPLVNQNTIDDMVKASVEEHLKVLGVRKSPEKNDKLSIVGEEQSLSLPSLQQKNLAKELDKDTGVKRTLAEEFGSGAATPVKSPEFDFVYITPAKATKPTKATKANKDDKDAQDAKGKAYGRCMRGRHIVKDEHAADKKKTEQAEAVLKKKEKADARKKQTELKKQQAEAKKKEKAELKKQQAEAKQKEAELKKKKLTPPSATSEDDSDVQHVTDEARAEENEVLAESDVDNLEMIRSAVARSLFRFQMREVE
ncbi:hypothetical protein Bca52824_027094 [Brassica carinata]|uniref:Uncharacterized protein n=1 Tax=Brassica carinata TaxID=52824 RepID=A0A8X7SIU1_BRACI|nr:hypothetical protein Bca52824_027094 [Brassica carinata]